jgi:SAM-dependent methyltransferase
VRSKEKFWVRAISELEKHKNKGIVLDLGCGEGYFLKLAKEREWKTYGVDVSDEACRFARNKLGLEIFQGELADAHFPSDFFDVVTLWDVLDHLVDPLDVLAEINRIVKDDGLIIVRVRNFVFHRMLHLLFLSLQGIATAFKIKDPSVFHLYSFSPSTIRRLFEKAGLECLQIRNAPVTSGDPHCVWGLGIGGDIVLDIAKQCSFVLSELIVLISNNRWLLGPSIEVWARKQAKYKMQTYPEA